MKVLIIGHAYAASYNRKDKLSRIVKDARIKKLAVIIPKNWHDRMMDKPRHYEKIPEDELYQVELLRTFPSGVQSKYLFLPWSLHQIVQSFNPDIIHSEQELHDWILWEIVTLNRFFWKKLLSVFIWENLRRNSGRTARQLISSAARQVDLLIGGNSEAVEIAREQGFKGKSAVIPQFGVDEKRFRPMKVEALRQELKLQDSFVIGFVGRYVPEKGIATLVRAFNLLVQRADASYRSDVALLLISSMRPPEWLKQEAKNLGHRVRFLESIPHEEFPKYMNLFNVLVLPSETQKDWQEQFGRVMIEAMSCGVPVVGSSSGAIPEVVNGAGLVFRERDAQDLAKKLTLLQRNPTQLVELSQKARPYVLENYTHDRIVKKTIDQWEKLL